jgi:hypothetical protein
MNEPEKEKILAMISEGLLRPDEAASLLAALSDEPKAVIIAATSDKKSKEQDQPTTKAADKQPLMEVQMQRADGSSYTIQVPPNLVPLFWNIAKVAVKESARTAAQETWSGFKHIVKRKTREVGANVKDRVSSIGNRPAAPALQAVEDDGIDRLEARRQILQMIQNGRLTAVDAARLIEQLDALDLYVKARSAPLMKPTT